MGYATIWGHCKLISCYCGFKSILRSAGSIIIDIFYHFHVIFFICFLNGNIYYAWSNLQTFNIPRISISKKNVVLDHLNSIPEGQIAFLPKSSIVEMYRALLTLYSLSQVWGVCNASRRKTKERPNVSSKINWLNVIEQFRQFGLPRLLKETSPLLRYALAAPLSVHCLLYGGQKSRRYTKVQ